MRTTAGQWTAGEGKHFVSGEENECCSTSTAPHTEQPPNSTADQLDNFKTKQGAV